MFVFAARVAVTLRQWRSISYLLKHYIAITWVSNIVLIFSFNHTYNRLKRPFAPPAQLINCDCRAVILHPSLKKDLSSKSTASSEASSIINDALAPNRTPDKLLPKVSTLSPHSPPPFALPLFLFWNTNTNRDRTFSIKWFDSNEKF